MPHQYHTLILGSGDCARQIADELCARGLDVLMTGAHGEALKAAIDVEGAITFREDARLIDCQGQAGSFRVTLDQGGRRSVCQVASIVVAEQASYTPNFAAYGLQPSQRVLSIPEAAALAGQGFAEQDQAATHVLFLNDWTMHCHPVTAEGMLRLCLAVQQRPHTRTVYLAGQLKVSADGMESRCQAAKAAGTVFFKFDHELPRLTTMADGRIHLSCWDDTTRLALDMTFDYVVVDERITPSASLAHLARVLRLDCDTAGFVQSDNVHRLSNATNRRGVFVAGGARAIVAPNARQADAGHVALKVFEFLSDLDRTPLPRVQIDNARCARCLTCYRLCPHAALAMNPRMTILPEACQSCGLCAAGCPNRAIRVYDTEMDAALSRLPALETNRLPNAPFVPRLVAFCCRRSAVPAREMAITLGQSLPSGLVVVEGICGGTFSVRHLLSALEAGVDGVMILTCHQGNCHSENGPRNAGQRVAVAAQALALANIDPQRVHFSTLAGNMGADFAREVRRFAEKIASLGPILEKGGALSA